MLPAQLHPDPVVPDGVADLRRRIRDRAALAGLAFPIVAGLVAIVLLRGSETTARGVLGTAAALLAAPLLLVVGGPLATTTPLLLAVVGSLVLWLVVGATAGRRALRSVVADWRDVRREWWWLALPLWTGEFVALLVVDVLVGGVLL